MKARKLHLFLLTALALTLETAHAQSVSLDFSNPVGTPTGTNGLGGMSYYRTSTLDFLDVATSGPVVLDLRVTASTWGGMTFGSAANSGYYADYSSNTGEPNDDLGVYHTATTTGLGGVHYDLSFYLGGTGFTTPYTVGQLDLLIYDVDGEASQSEKLRAYTAEGLVSYRTGSNAASVTPSIFTGGVLFTGPGTNYAETDVSGAFILTYENTSHFRLDFESTTTGTVPNAVFASIDGDLSMLNGDLSGFGPVTSAPEPSSALLLAVAGMMMQFRRRRTSSRSIRRPG
ncbi:MAG: PEP-CTERM sorting domain-containing protein [Prosthecobacter sp.]|uniref:PEP-CTERM sorting domain-containing protein n=1 Tax=Prosthecobacter sp. TaxID=1965333 RepID=UPI0038FD92E7